MSSLSLNPLSFQAPPSRWIFLNMAVDEKTDAQFHETVPTRDADVGDAIELAQQAASAKYSPWTPSMFRLYGCLTIAYLCGCLNGYDGSLMGSLNAMQSYLDYFHMYVQPCKRNKRPS